MPSRVNLADELRLMTIKSSTGFLWLVAAMASRPLEVRLLWAAQATRPRLDRPQARHCRAFFYLENVYHERKLARQQLYDVSSSLFPKSRIPVPPLSSDNLTFLSVRFFEEFLIRDQWIHRDR